MSMARSTVIFGGSGGIGAALARQLIADGGRVHLIARDADKLSALCGETGATAAAADVNDAASLQTAIAAAGDAIDALVYAVGTINLKSVAQFAGARYRSGFCSQRARRIFRRAGGLACTACGQRSRHRAVLDSCCGAGFCDACIGCHGERCH